jgi:hypothetical protein
MLCLLYSPKEKIVKFHAQKQIGKSHVIDILTSEDMENISLCIFQYLTLYYYTIKSYNSRLVLVRSDKCIQFTLEIYIYTTLQQSGPSSEKPKILKYFNCTL